MKAKLTKLFTLLTILTLGITNVWAADPTHDAPATKTTGGKTYIDAANTPGNAGDEAYINYGVMKMDSKKGDWAWFEYGGTWSKSNSSYSLPTGAVGFCTPGSSSSSEFYGKVNFNTSSKTTSITIYFTGTTEVGFIWKNNNTSNNRWIVYTLQELKASDGTDVGDPSVFDTHTSTSVQYNKFTSLDGTKYYKLVMSTSGASSSEFYGFTLKKYVAPATKYSVTYKAGEGTGDDVVDSDAKTVKAFADCSFTAPTGYEFKEWQDGSSNVVAAGATVSADMTLTAIYRLIPTKYTVTYNLNGASGDAPTETDKAEGDAFNLAAAPSWAGHAFDGWLCSADAAVKAAGSSYTMTAAPTTFTAQWHELDCKIYSLTGGIGSATAEADEGNVVIDASSLVLKSSNAIIKLTPGSGTFKAGDILTISGTVGNTSKNFGVKISASNNKGSGLGLASVAGTSNPMVATATLSADADYLYICRDGGTTQTLLTCEVHRSCAEGTAAGLSYVAAEVNKTEGDATFTNPLTNANSLVLDGYKSSNEEVAAVNFSTGEVTIVGAGSATITANSAIQTKAGTLYAAGTASYTLTVAALPKYHVTYDLNGGSGDVAEVDHKAGEKFTLHDGVTGVTAPGSKTFVNWKDQDDALFDGGVEFTMPGKDVTLTAQWAGDVYTVKFMDGENVLDTKVVEVGSHPTDIEHPTKPLYTFAAWQLSGSDVVLDDVTGTKDATVILTARWEAAYALDVNFKDAATQALGVETALNTYHYASDASDISFEGKGLKIKTDAARFYFNVAPGKVAEIKFGDISGATYSVDGGAAETLSASQLKATYSASAQSCVMTMTTAAYNIVEKITIHDPYTVSFDANGGDDVTSLNGIPSVTLPGATKGTESFLGWFDADDNKIGEAGETYTPTANITLKAHWEAVSTDARLASITFSAAGTLSPAFDPEVTNYTYTMPYGTAAVPTITGATKANPAAKDPVIDAQATAWGETAHVHGVAASDDTKDYYVQMLRAPKDGASIFKAELTSATTATYSGIYADADNSQIKLADDGANGYKFSGTSNFIKMTLDGGTFATGDLLTMTYSKDPQQGELAIYENTTKIVGTSFENHTLEFTAGADGLTELFIRRTSDNDFNGWVSVVEVTRVVNPILTAITFAGEAGTINESLKTVTVTVPNATDLGSMTVVPTIVRNAPHATTPEAVITNAGAWVEGPNTYRIMDKDGDYTDYTVTITRAALSTDATLSSLTVNGQAIALADGVFEYSFELPYGTSSAPTVVATPHHIAAVATVDPCTLSGATITVVPESGAGDQKVYTLTFTISPWKEVVIWDGSYMTDVETSPDATGLAWEAVGCTGIENWAYATDEPNGKVPAYCSDNDKTYTHVNGSGKNECNIFRTGGNTKNTRYFQITVPAGYVAKFYVVYGSHSEGTELTMSIGTEASATATDGILSLTTDHRYLLSGGMSEVVGAGDYYLNATGSADFFEIRAYLRPGYGRKVSNNIGTLCVDHNVPAGAALGATFYQLVGKEPTYGKLVFDEVTELEAGEPYIFESTTGSIALYYGETVQATPLEVNGMVGSYTNTEVEITEENKTSVMYIASNKLWDCSDYQTFTNQKLQVVANRAYIYDYNAIGTASPNPAPGRRRITVGKDGQNAATGIGNVQGDEVQSTKVLINGQLFILRGEKMYDATGRMVK